MNWFLWWLSLNYVRIENSLSTCQFCRLVWSITCASSINPGGVGVHSTSDENWWCQQQIPPSTTCSPVTSDKPCSTYTTWPYAMATNLQQMLFDWMLSTSRPEMWRHKQLVVAVRIPIAGDVPIIGLFCPIGFLFSNFIIMELHGCLPQTVVV